jgi:hypothetical protein
MKGPITTVVLAVSLVAGCDGDARETQKTIHDEHMGYVAQIIRQDRAEHRTGIREAAERLAPGFVAEVEDAEERERQMRYALRYVQEPPRGVSEFIVSPMSFLAAVGSDGVVIARDGSAEDDRMKGQNFAERFEMVRVALEEGRAGYELVEFESAEEGGESSFSMLFVAPSKKDGEVVGAAVAGIPLWREAQRLTRQLQVDAGEVNDLIFWVYLYKGDQLFHFGTPEGIDAQMNENVGTPSARAEGLARSPGGYTGEVMVNGRWFAYGVLPIPSLGEDMGAVIWRSDPI